MTLLRWAGLLQPKFLQALVPTCDKGEVLFLHRGSAVTSGGDVPPFYSSPFSLPHCEPPTPIYIAQGLSLREVVELVKASKQQAQPPGPHWECAAGIQRSAGLEQVWNYKFCP